MSVPLAEHERRHKPKDLTANPDTSQNSSTGVGYEPHPERSISIPPEREEIITKINNLYSGKPSEDDMKVYAAEAVYDDPFTFCDTRYKIAGQWYGVPMLFASSKILKTEVVRSEPKELSFKKQHEFTPKLVHFSKSVNSLVTLTLDDEGKVKYHKESWNEKDYSHEGLGMVMKKLNGDQATKFTRPPKDL